jgi:endogenous inhibitor of DNA gyrase (YacG/DUF329 family)
MIDLGAWAGENYRVPGEPLKDHEHPDDEQNKKKTIH